MCSCALVYECILLWTYSILPLQAQLPQARERVDESHQSYQSLDAGLGSMEEVQEKEERIYSEVAIRFRALC